jgi:hypothetical protein
MLLLIGRLPYMGVFKREGDELVLTSRVHQQC